MSMASPKFTAMLDKRSAAIEGNMMTVKPAKNGWEIDGSFKFNSTNHGIAIPNYLGVTVYPDMVGHAKFTLVDV